ncbi:MAG: suppressor of fused domain protein [Pseudomonadota bacterium]
MRRAAALALLLVVGCAEGDQGPAADTGYASALTTHLETEFGTEVATVITEIVPGEPQLDLLPVPPTANWPYWTVVTLGMATKSMTVPPGFDRIFARAELAVVLPADWFGPDGASPDGRITEENWAPLADLKELARFPHSQNTWLGPGHTVQWGRIGAASEMSAYLVHWPETMQIDVVQVPLPDGAPVNIYAIFPVHPGELDFAMENDSDALLELLLDRPDPLVWNLQRRPVIGPG